MPADLPVLAGQRLKFVSLLFYWAREKPTSSAEVDYVDPGLQSALSTLRQVDTSAVLHLGVGTCHNLSQGIFDKRFPETLSPLALWHIVEGRSMRVTDDRIRTDGELLAEFASAGNEAAFAALVQRHGGMVQTACRRVLADHHEAQDVAQAVFLTLARKAASLRKDTSVAGWLHTVASRLALNARESRCRRQRREQAAMDEQTVDAVAAEDTAAFRLELDAAISQMPERYRKPLVLFHLEDRSADETAGLLALNPSTLRNRLARARKMLRTKLVRRGVTVGSVGALTALLSAEAGAAVLPATFVSATVKAAGLAAAGKLAAGVGTGVVSAKVAALTKGALNMLFWNSVKTAAVAVAASVVVVGGGAIVAQEVAAQRKAAEQPTAAVAGVHKTMEDELRRAQDLMKKGTATAQQARTMADEAPRLKAMASARNDFRQAAEVFENAAKDNPSHPLAPRVTLLAGPCFMRAEEWDSAIRVLTASSENAAADAEVRAEGLYWLADCFTKKGDDKNAARMSNKLSSEYSASVWAKYARGRLSEDKFQGLQGDDGAAEPPTAAQPPAGEVRFIRLKHAGPGWDDGLDDSGADRNFLERFGQVTGFGVSTNGEAHGIELLAKYPKGFAPAFVYITGSGEMGVSDDEVRVLKEYLAGGGMLWADCGGPQWDTSFRALMTRVFPDTPLRDIPDDDSLFSVPFKLPNGAPPLWHHGGRRAFGIKFQDRWAVFYHPGDMNDAWKTGHSGLSDAAAQPAFELGVNVVSYALKVSQNPAPDYEVPGYPANSLPEGEATLLGEADKHFAKKDYAQAAAAYDSFVLKYPKSKAVAYALVRKGRALQFVGKRPEAIKVYGGLLEYYPDPISNAAPARLYLAQCHYLDGNAKEATKTIAQLRADKDYGKHEAAACAAFLLARMQADGGKTDEALATLRAIGEPFPAYSALAQLRQAEVHEKAGRTAEAVAAYRETLKTFPKAQEADLAHRALERMGRRSPGGAQAEP